MSLVVTLLIIQLSVKLNCIVDIVLKPLQRYDTRGELSKDKTKKVYDDKK